MLVHACMFACTYVCKLLYIQIVAVSTHTSHTCISAVGVNNLSVYKTPGTAQTTSQDSTMGTRYVHFITIVSLLEPKIANTTKFQIYCVHHDIAYIHAVDVILRVWDAKS